MDIRTSADPVIRSLYPNRSHMELTIGILKNGETQIIHLDPEQKESDEVLTYPVGSICKTFTASLLAKYIAEGKADLNAPLSAYISGLPEQYYPSLRRLAVHSSGYGGKPFGTLETLIKLASMNRPDGLLHVNPFRGTVDENVMRNLIAGTKLKDKEYKFEYSNLAYGILGYILGIIGGKNYWDLMNDYAHNDLGLKDTMIGNVPLTGYDKKENPCSCWKWEKSDVITAAGALNSTALDMLKYASVQMDGSRPYLDLCHQVQGTGEKDFRSGLAWRLTNDGISWHTGSAGAFSAWLGLCRRNSTAVFIGTNYGLADVENPGLKLLRSL